MSSTSSLKIFLRLVEERDRKMIFDLANDPVTRSNSFVSREIGWEDHCEWFDERLQKAHCPFYIALDPYDNVIGVVRFDEKRFCEYVMTLNLTPPFRGKGFGSRLISESLTRFKESFKFTQITVVVKESNAASIKSFLNAGFVENGHSVQYGNEAFELIYKSDSLNPDH